MKFKFLFFPFIVLTLSYCSHRDMSDNKSIGIINLKDAFEKRKPVNITDISTDLNYIQLETNDKCLVGTRLTVYADDIYLIAIDRQKILLFNRKDGKFIREIGHQGNGPGEYSRTYTVMPYDEEKKIVYAGENKKRYGYSLDGQLKDTLTIPELVSEIGNIDDSLFAAFIPDYQGGGKNKIIIFNQRDSLIKVFPNYLSAPKTESVFIWNPGSLFYRLDRQLSFFQLFNDTIFHVSSDSLTPRFVFNMGPYSPPYEMKTSPQFEPDKYFLIRTINESSKYLFCAFNFNKSNYTAIYDKDKRTTVVNDYSPGSGNGFLINTNDFVPPEISSINMYNELICTIDAVKIKQWFEKNPEKVPQLPESLKSLITIKETDNPVIIISKLKK